MWYKDEGGRDKCMTIAAVLVDENDQPVKTRCVAIADDSDATVAGTCRCE
jgi:hypothetical protein